MRKVLKRFRIANFQIDINKYEFFVIQMNHLKLIISMNEIRMNVVKTKMIIKWKTLINFKHVKSFVNFCNFYRRFIKSFFKIVKLLNAFMKKISYSFETMFMVWFFENSKTKCWKRRFFFTSIEKNNVFWKSTFRTS